MNVPSFWYILPAGNAIHTDLEKGKMGSVPHVGNYPLCWSVFEQDTKSLQLYCPPVMSNT